MKSIDKKTSQPPGRQVEYHLNVKLLPFLVLAFATLYLLTGFRGWLVFTLGTAGAWLIGGLWILSLQRNLRIDRKIHLAWATAGESVPEEIKLINRGWLPALWVEITDESSSLESPLRLVSDVGQHSSRTRHLNHFFQRRGLYTLGPTQLRCGDPLGIYTLTLKDPHASTILVTPPILSLSHIKIPTGGWSGDERHRAGYVERKISDAGLRNYTAGDSLKRIHWRASAHFDDLIVRQLESASSNDWWIYVDLDTSSQAGIGEHSTLELSIVLAASLALRGLREYRKVGLVMAGSHFTRLEPRSDPAQSWRILRALAMAEAGNRALPDLFLQSRLGQSGTLVLITPSTNPAWVAAVNRPRKGGSVLALLIDPTDFGSPLGQDQARSALAHSRVPYVRIPGSMLDEAYSTAVLGTRKKISAGETGKRYLQQGRQSWQRMD